MAGASVIRFSKISLTARFVGALLPWFAQNARDLPWRRTLNPYAIWISEVMLQQTQVKTVIPYWARWMTALPTLEALATCRTDRVLKLWEGLGYYHRARNLQNAARQILREHKGQFPSEFDAVLQLPGIGRYTAGAICSIAFNQPTPVLDGNAIRVLTRFFGIRGDPSKGEVNHQLWILAETLVKHAAEQLPPTKRNCSAFNQAVMELGATVCTATNPICGGCPVRGRCYARRTACVEKLPELPSRRPSERRRFVAVVIQHQGRFFVRQRPGGVVNAGLWEFPNGEVLPGEEPRKVATTIARAEVQHLCAIHHTITRYRMTLEAFYSRPEGIALLGPGKWLSSAQAAALAYPSAHRRVLEHALRHVNRSTPAGAPALAAPGGSTPRGQSSRLFAGRC